MNREIKFRAWDTERNQFVPQGEIIFSDYGDTNIEVHPNDLSYVGDSCHNGEPQRGRFIITQYTCVKDNNGNEIYHKDIFVLSDRVGEVEWERDRWVVQFKDYNVSLFDFIFNDKGRAVSGNIYENPDLL